MSEQPQADLLTVKTVSQLSGITSFTLRAWERRYQAIQPRRSHSGQRLYSLKDLEKLQTLKKLVDMGFSIGQIAGKEVTDLKSLLEQKELKSSINTLLQTSKTQKPSEPYEDLVNELLSSLRNFELNRIQRILNKARTSFSARDFVFKFSAPLLGQMGFLVCKGEFSLSQEYALSALLKNQLVLIIQNASIIPSKSYPVFTLATPEGDYHEFGILLCQILCLTHDFQTHYLGPSLPTQPLSQAAEALETTHLILSQSPSAPEEKKKPFDQYLKQLDQQLPSSIEIWAGGAGVSLNDLPRLKHKFEYIPSLEKLDQILSQIQDKDKN